MHAFCCGKLVVVGRPGSSRLLVCDVDRFCSVGNFDSVPCEPFGALHGKASSGSPGEDAQERLDEQSFARVAVK